MYSQVIDNFHIGIFMHFYLLMGLGVSCIRCYTCSPCNDFRKDAKLVQCPKSTTSCITEIFESVGKNNSSKVSGKICMAEIKKTYMMRVVAWNFDI